MHQDELRCLLLTRCLPRLPHDIGSALGQARSMSAMQLIAALYRTSRSVRVVPEADIGAGRGLIPFAIINPYVAHGPLTTEPLIITSALRRKFAVLSRNGFYVTRL
jgi:hypothetical protein